MLLAQVTALDPDALGGPIVVASLGLVLVAIGASRRWDSGSKAGSRGPRRLRRCS